MIATKLLARMVEPNTMPGTSDVWRTTGASRSQGPADGDALGEGAAFGSAGDDVSVPPAVGAAVGSAHGASTADVGTGSGDCAQAAPALVVAMTTMPMTVRRRVST